MNVLIIATSIADKSLALIPSEELEGVDLDKIEGCSNISDGEYGSQVGMLIDRLGIHPFLPKYTEGQLRLKGENPSEFYEKYVENWTLPPFRSEKDLMKYLDPKPPFIVHKVVHVCYEG